MLPSHHFVDEGGGHVTTPKGWRCDRHRQRIQICQCVVGVDA
jgi:hypothetical protein